MCSICSVVMWVGVGCGVEIVLEDACEVCNFGGVCVVFCVADVATVFGCVILRTD